MLELLPTILLRFRENRIGVIADIRIAFQMIQVNESDRDFFPVPVVGESRDETVQSVSSQESRFWRELQSIPVGSSDRAPLEVGE